MAQPLTLAQHTLCAELMERALDAMFDEHFQENGSFVTRKATNKDGVTRDYLYYIGYRAGSEGDAKTKRYSRYVGPADEPEIAARVERFKAIKASRKEGASIVGALIGAGLPRPPAVMGRMIEALAKAGVFRLRAVLVGTAAYQTYPAVLGYRLSGAAAQTGDVDIAQFRSISIAVDDKTPPLIDALRSVDPTFLPVPHINDPIASIAFRNASGFTLDVVTAHRGSDDQMGKPMRMPALEGASAEPLRFMDFLLRDPVRSVLLHGAGIAVTVPSPPRFAIHKMIISQRRQKDAVGQAKARKDLVQAAEIINAMQHAGRFREVDLAHQEAMERGPTWRSLLQQADALMGLETPWSSRRS
jgi:hypothetical protein